MRPLTRRLDRHDDDPVGGERHPRDDVRSRRTWRRSPTIRSFVAQAVRHEFSAQLTERQADETFHQIDEGLDWIREGDGTNRARDT